MEERRKFFRLNTDVDITYAKHDVSEKEKVTIAKNISKGGICLVVHEEVKKSDLLDLKIYLPKTETPISTLGKVVWVNELLFGGFGGVPQRKRYDAGIEFVKIADEDVNKIGKYIFTIIEQS